MSLGEFLPRCERSSHSLSFRVVLQFGGALAVLHFANAIVESSEFIKNSAATKDGGAIYGVPSDATIAVYRCNFESNEAGRNGGAIFYSDNPSELKIALGAFVKNSATDGGALYVTFVSPPMCTCEAAPP